MKGSRLTHRLHQKLECVSEQEENSVHQNQLFNPILTISFLILLSQLSLSTTYITSYLQVTHFLKVYFFTESKLSSKHNILSVYIEFPCIPIILAFLIGYNSL